MSKAEYLAAYYAAHRETAKAYAKAYRAANRERILAQRAGFRALHRVEARAKTREWQRANPEKAREGGQRHKARKRGAFVEKVDVAVLVVRDSGLCGICHAPVAESERSVDHILPLVFGGAHSYANTRLTHRSCNVQRRHLGAAQLRLVG